MANFGHGHVFPREDGVKVRCGGPAICEDCARDYAVKMNPSPAKGYPVLTVSLWKAIRHAANYYGLDARLDMADHAIADLITGEVAKHLAGRTDVQVYERMTPEERALIGRDDR